MRWFYFLLCLLLLGCEKEPLQFFPQNHYYANEYIDESEDYSYKEYTIVMVSPPETNLEIIEAVDKYIAENYSLDEIKQYKTFKLYFLKESSVTKRVYQDWDQYLAFKKGLIAQTPRFNPEDKIVLVAWRQRGFYNNKFQPSKQYAFYNDYKQKRGCSKRIITIFYEEQNEEKKKKEICGIKN